jgi:hypothetical protein
MTIKYIQRIFLKALFPLVKREIDIKDMEIYINLNNPICLYNKVCLKDQIYIGHYFFENGEKFKNIKNYNFGYFNRPLFKNIKSVLQGCDAVLIKKFKLENNKLYIWTRR